MVFQYKRISRNAHVFRAMTGLSVREFDSLAEEVLPLIAKADRRRLDEARPQRQREMGGGRTPTLKLVDQLLLTIVWLRKYPTHETLGYQMCIRDSCRTAPC